MRVTMTNKEMITTVNNIVEMQDREAQRGEKLFGNKIKVIYAIKKNKEKLTQLLKPYDEARKELLEECNKKEAQLEGRVDIRKDCLEQWNRGVQELLDIEVEVEVHMVKATEIDGLTLSLNDFEAIEFMLEDLEDLAK